MIGSILIEYKGATPRIARKELNQHKRESWRETGEFFHTKMLPKRFTNQGAKELDYTPRKGEELGLSPKEFWRSYTGRKKRQKGHTRPLTWSGLSERLARIRDLRVTSKGVRVVNHARGLNRQHPKSDVKPSDEVQRVSAREGRKLTRVFGGDLGARLKGIRTTKRKKIK